jgi:hypothetical protein
VRRTHDLMEAAELIHKMEFADLEVYPGDKALIAIVVSRIVRTLLEPVQEERMVRRVEDPAIGWPERAHPPGDPDR